MEVTEAAKEAGSTSQGLNGKPALLSPDGVFVLERVTQI